MITVPITGEQPQVQANARGAWHMDYYRQGPVNADDPRTEIESERDVLINSLAADGWVGWEPSTPPYYRFVRDRDGCREQLLVWPV